MTSENTIRVLLIDDHALIREGLTRLINDQPDMEVIGEAAEGRTGVRLAQELIPDIALVDISMPGLDGTQVTRLIASTCPRVRVIALSRHHDGSFVQRLLDAGASGYALKQSASTELTGGIRAVAAGEQYLDRSIRPMRASSSGTTAAVSSDRAELTAEEERVLGMLALGHSHEGIAKALSMEVPRVLAVREAAVSKAGLASRGAIVRYAQERGWLGRGARGRSDQ
jgi:DNA-binding NarL/FixJ family response regulator